MDVFPSMQALKNATESGSIIADRILEKKEQEGYNDDSIFDMPKYEMYVKENASEKAYKYWSAVEMSQ